MRLAHEEYKKAQETERQQKEEAEFQTTLQSIHTSRYVKEELREKGYSTVKFPHPISPSTLQRLTAHFEEHGYRVLVETFTPATWMQLRL